MMGRQPSWPLVELHTHLEGAVTALDVWTCAAELDFKLPWSSMQETRAAITLPDRPCGLKEWAPFFNARRSLFSSPEFITALSRKVLNRYHAFGCRHVELRFNPIFIAKLVGVAEDIVVKSVADAVDDLQEMSVGLIVLATRHCGPQEAIQSAEVAARNRCHGVVAFDLAGQELEHPAQDFVEAFDIARRAGLHLTAHAGEESGPESIRAALDVLGVERIGHGLTLEQDPSLLAEIVRRQVPLEMCPISNCRTGVTANIAAHPLIRYLRAGIRVTINSDDPGLFGTTLRDEWDQVKEAFQPTHDEQDMLLRNSIDAAFLNDHERALLRTRVDKDLARMRESGVLPN